MRPRLWCSLKSGVIYRNKTKLGPIAIGPFIVIKQRPVVIATNVYSISNTTEHPVERCANILDPFLVTVCSNSILSDNDRLFATL